jgi:hypothetical protein
LHDVQCDAAGDVTMRRDGNEGRRQFLKQFRPSNSSLEERKNGSLVEEKILCAAPIDKRNNNHPARPSPHEVLVGA